jgi:hypothetical protein
MKNEDYQIIKLILKGLIEGQTKGEWSYLDDLFYSLSEKIESEASPKRFYPPTMEEVASHLNAMNVINAEQEAEKFWNFYESKGWMIGKNKMKSWQHAIKTWKFAIRGKRDFII